MRNGIVISSCIFKSTDEKRCRQCLLAVLHVTELQVSESLHVPHDSIVSLFLRVTPSFMPRLHLPYNEDTMSLRCPNHRFRAASAGRPCDHRTDLRASWPLRFCLAPHNDKFEKNRKPVARRHIAVTSYDPRTGTAR